MLAGLSSTALTEWSAYFTIEEEDRQQQALSDEAAARLEALKRKGPTL